MRLFWTKGVHPQRCAIGHESSFPHLCRPDLKVFVVLDICHMLKLARNALEDMKSFVTSSRDKVSWEALYDIQQ